MFTAHTGRSSRGVKATGEQRPSIVGRKKVHDLQNSMSGVVVFAPVTEVSVCFSVYLKSPEGHPTSDVLKANSES